MTTIDPSPTSQEPETERPSRAARSATFRSLQHRNVRLFLGGQLISQTGTWLTMVTQTLLVLSLTRSGIVLGLLTAAQFGPVLILGAWAGAVADRVDKRRFLMILQSLAMVQSAALGVVVLLGWATVPAIFALAAVQGVLTALDNPTRRSFVTEMVPPEDINNAVSLNSAIMTGARVVGPAVAGGLILLVGYGWPFIIDSLTYIAVLTGLYMMRPDELHGEAPVAKAKGQVRAGLRYLRADPRLLVPIVMMAIIGTFAYNFTVTVPLMVDGPLGGDTTTFTFLYSVLSVGSLIGALITARRLEVTSVQLVTAAIGFGIAMLLLAAAPNLLTGFPAAILLGLTSIAFMTSSTAIVQVLAGPEYRGRVLAIQSMVFLGSKPIGGPLVGWIADVAGPRSAVAVGGLACLVAAAYGARTLQIPIRRRHRVDPTVTEEHTLDDESVALVD